MCLRTLEKQPAIAGEDIVCYKTMYAMCSTQAVNMERHPFYNPDHLLSTWKFHRYEWDKVEEVDDMPLKPDPSGRDCVWRIVERGFHSYPNEEDAVEMCGRMPWRRGCVVAKCVIPKGARYWRGNDPSVRPGAQPGYFEYCSDRIKVVAWRLPLRGSKWTSAEDARRERQYLLPAD